MNKYIIYVLLGFLVFTMHTSKCFGQSQPTCEMSYFEDVNSVHSLTSIKQEKFKSASKKIVNFGVTENTLWLKIKLKSHLLPSKAVLQFNSPFVDHITLSYVLQNGKEVSETLGIMYPYSKNKLEHYLPVFEIPVTKLASPTMYLKVQSRWPMVFSVDVKSKEEFHKKRTKKYLVAGLLIGGLLLMACYNLFLFFSTRDFGYMLYVCALLSAILSQGYIFGILIPYISPESPEFSFRFPIYIMASTGLFSSWFALHFLEIKKRDGIIYYALLFAIVFALSSMLLEFLHFDYISRKVNLILVITISIIIFSSAIYSLVKGNKAAIYFTIAWTFYLMGMTVYSLKILGIVPHNDFTKHFMHIGTFMEVILLSFALGHKYYLVRLEKERLEHQTRDELEQLVRLQTTELEASLEEKEILLKEVHHRVKNNLQIIISLLDLQLASVKETRNKEILAQSKSRVYSMSLIHQKLYQSDNLARVDMKNYLEELFSYVRNSYSNTEQKTTYTVSVDHKELSLTQAVPLGLIVNELLTNSFKYGLKSTDDNLLKMSLHFYNDNLELIIADSGLGFDESQQKQDVKKSLGLFLVKSLIKQLRGTLSRYHDDEMFVTKLSIPMND